MASRQAADYGGARGSNAGDQFHELWALQQILGLLKPKSTLAAVTIEGIQYAEPPTTVDAPTWDGVDCALFHGHPSLDRADRVELVQLKYSGSSPDLHWTIARLAANTKKTGNNSVIRRLADDFAAARARMKPGAELVVRLVSNQPAGSDVRNLLAHADSTAQSENRRKVQQATGLKDEEFDKFLSSLDVGGCGSFSRFALNEAVAGEVISLLGDDVRGEIEHLQSQVRTLMLPERSREVVDERKLLVWFGLGGRKGLFPCPPAIEIPEMSIERVGTDEVLSQLDRGMRIVVLHGDGGCGKTTLTQQLPPKLPFGSIAVTFDCYGAGSYMHSEDKRHLSERALLQIINDVAVAIDLPLLLPRSGSHPVTIETFLQRMTIAGKALELASPGAILLVIIDAADNAVTAAAAAVPVVRPFIHDIAEADLSKLPGNVRFVVSARTARKEGLGFPHTTAEVLCPPFSAAETGIHLRTVFPEASDTSIASFHDLSGGIPRVQSYALKASEGSFDDLFTSLLPNGRSLAQVLDASFSHALAKLGRQAELDNLTAALAFLPMPATVVAVAAVAGTSEQLVRDFAADLAPGIRLSGYELTVSDEDFEDHIATRSKHARSETIVRIANHFRENYRGDRYASTYVVDFLLSAGRVADIFVILETDRNVAAVGDPLLRREIQLRRLTIALATCRDVDDKVKAVQTVLIGAEAQHDESAFFNLVDRELDLSVEFSGPSLIRRTLLDRDRAHMHGSVLSHCALSASLKGDRTGVFHFLRMYDAWLAKRPRREDGYVRGSLNEHWKVDDNDIAACIEAVFRVAGANAANRELDRWSPRSARLRIALLVIPRLIADGYGQELMDFANAFSPRGPWRLLVTVPLALAGFDVDSRMLASDLGKLRKIFMPGRDLGSASASFSWTAEWLRLLLTAMEILFVAGGHAEVLQRAVGLLLRAVTNDVAALYPSDPNRVDAVMRLWILRESVAGRTIDKQTFLAFANQIGPRLENKTASTKRNRKSAATEDYEAKQEREKRSRKLSAVFDVYRRRIGVMHNAAKASLDAEDLQGLGNLVEPHEIDLDYDANYARRAIARSISDLLFLTGISIADLCDATLRSAAKKFGTYQDRDVSILSAFRLRVEFHAALLKKIGDAAEEITQRRTRATEKMTELVALARFVFPLSRPDAEVFFNDAVDIAKEIDEEAIDQIDFLARAAVAARASSEPGDAEAASKLAVFAAAASIRLEGHDDFSWDDVLRGLVHVHSATAFACTGRWMDDGTAMLRDTLLPLLLESLSINDISHGRAAALSLLVAGPNTAFLETLARGTNTAANDDKLVEELARATLLSDGQGARINRARTLLNVVGERVDGPWLAQVRKMISFDATKPDRKVVETPKDPVADLVLGVASPANSQQFTPTSGSTWRVALENEIQNRSRTAEYTFPGTILRGISNRLRSPADRVPFLDAMTSIDEEIASAFDWSQLLSDLLENWKDTPSVQRWCRDRLPGVISEHLSVFSRYLRHGQSNLDQLLAFARVDTDRGASVLLDGIAESGMVMGSGALFGLASRLVAMMDSGDAKRILDWYLDRLFSRLPKDDRESLRPVDVPSSIAEALPRFLYALLSDIDTRVRWRAAHAVRSLARLGDTTVLRDLFCEHGKDVDQAFRDPNSPFYGLGARLWLALIAYRLSDESPAALVAAKDFLLVAALDPELPHVVVREYAKRALLLASDRGAITLSEYENRLLVELNVPKKRVQAAETNRVFERREDRGSRRFSFDETDTIPYWYSDLFSMFPEIPAAEILSMAERWILDVWKAPTDIYKWVKEPRRDRRLSDHSYDLWAHRHGSLPTVERYSTYLEWHAMLCVAGELLQTSAVAKEESGEDRFADWLKDFLPTHPPLWLSDLRGPTPLIPELWWLDDRKDARWFGHVRNSEYIEALGLFGAAPEGWIVAGASVSNDHPTREQHLRIHSALVSPETAAALTRALQSVRDPWDFRIPDEDDDEIDQPPYRMTGWLASLRGDRRFDDHDPLRFGGRGIQCQPGREITKFMQLLREPHPSVQWTAAGRSSPSFIYESWSDEAPEERAQYRRTKSEGWRLLVRVEDLADFLEERGEDLICEVNIERALRNEYRQSYEPEAQQKKHFKILVLARDGSIRDIRGHAGVWKKARRRVQP
ncbi:hypothetical protein [Ensifer adhaerens]|uniref:hypothetical protein n=1 Tax=Ensifer adhaerens TaxID=106592 RepID=UPI0008072D26|nr:hypothetical protein [Ensifer adhaerens]